LLDPVGSFIYFKSRPVIVALTRWFILKWKLSRFRFALVIASLAGVTLDRRMRL